MKLTPLCTTRQIRPGSTEPVRMDPVLLKRSENRAAITPDLRSAMQPCGSSIGSRGGTLETYPAAMKM